MGWELKSQQSGAMGWGQSDLGKGGASRRGGGGGETMVAPSWPAGTRGGQGLRDGARSISTLTSLPKPLLAKALKRPDPIAS